MAGGFAGGSNGMDDLLGPPSSSVFGADAFLHPSHEPGKVVDLSGSSSFMPLPPPPSSFSSGSSGSSGHSSSSYYGGGGQSQPGTLGGRGPTSIEGGSGGGLSLAGLSPQNIARQLASRPVMDLVAENGRLIMEIPRYMARAYSSAARRYLRPWNEFARLRPHRIIEGIRQASRRGEVQVYLQRNVLANARAFCPNYAFIFLAMLFMFVCTSPYLLVMLSFVGGGWSHALRSEQFRSRPWMLQIGGVHLPLGSNAKMAMMSLPTLFFLHFFMGPVLWSAALCSGGVSLAHAALRDRDDDRDEDDQGPGGRLRDMA